MLRIITAKKLHSINGELEEYRQRALFAESQLAFEMCENRELHGQLSSLRKIHKNTCLQLDRLNKFIEEVKRIYMPGVCSAEAGEFSKCISNLQPCEEIRTANVIRRESQI